MGANSSKIFNSASNVTEKSMKTAKVVGSYAGRKLKKPYYMYRPFERADKEIQKQKEIPKRAPMNLKKVKIDSDIRKKKLEEIKKLQEKDLNLLKLMDKVKIISSDPKDFSAVPKGIHSHQRSESEKKKLPQKRHGNVSEAENVLKSTAVIEDLVDALHNHQSDPENWTAFEIAEKLCLRPSEVEEFLKNFQLLDDSLIHKKTSSQNKKISLS